MAESNLIPQGIVLTVPNHHVKMCGKPPELKAEGCYTAYLENCHGEQLVFQYDRKRKEGTLWLGDYSWNIPINIRNGRSPEMILSSDEQAWLLLVWQIATTL